MFLLVNRDKTRVILFVQVEDLSKDFTLSLFQLNGSEMRNGVSESLEANPSALFKYYVSHIVNFINMSLEIINKHILLALAAKYRSLSRIMKVDQMSAVLSNVSELHPIAQIALNLTSLFIVFLARLLQGLLLLFTLINLNRDRTCYYFPLFKLTNSFQITILERE